MLYIVRLWNDYEW